MKVITPRRENRLLFDYLIQSKNANLKFEAFWGDQRSKLGLIDILQMKVCICFKTFSKWIRIQKSIFKNQKLKTYCLIAQEDCGKTITLIKVLRAKRTPVTGIAKGYVMARKNKSFLVTMENICDLGDQWIQNILK